MIIENRDEFDSQFKNIQYLTINDSRLSNSALGVWLRLISKPMNWNISIAGFIAQFPKDKKDSIKTSLKELVKYRYLERLPQPRVEGRIVEPSLVLYHRPFSQEELSDDQVDFLFSNSYSKGYAKEEEIQKMFPKLVYHNGSAIMGNPPLVNTNRVITEEEKKNIPKGISKERSSEVTASSHEGLEKEDLRLHSKPSEPSAPKSLLCGKEESAGVRAPTKTTSSKKRTLTCPDDQKEKLINKLGKKKALKMIEYAEDYVAAKGEPGYVDWTRVSWAREKSEEYFKRSGNPDPDYEPPTLEQIIFEMNGGVDYDPGR